VDFVHYGSFQRGGAARAAPRDRQAQVPGAGSPRAPRAAARAGKAYPKENNGSVRCP